MGRKNAEADIIDKAIGRRILELRIARGFSRDQLGLRIEVSGTQLTKYEKGTNRISAGRLMAISKALGIKVSDFFEGIETFAPSLNAHEMLGLDLSRIFMNIKDAKQQVALVAMARTLH